LIIRMFHQTSIKIIDFLFTRFFHDICQPARLSGDPDK
jgi:hypothetical protein